MGHQHIGHGDRYVRRSVPMVALHRLTVSPHLNRHHERITLSAYQWLSENYVAGDRIYLFGVWS